MKRNQLIALVVILVLLAAGVWYVRSGRSGAVAIDLVEQFPQAETRTSLQPKEAAFAIKTETLAGETKQAVFMHPTSRMIYKRLDVPENGWLRLWLGVAETCWTKSTDGVLFRVGVSDGRTYDELLKQHVDPLHNTNDRRWIPVTIDLSAYVGQQVDITFNTNSSLPGAGDDPTCDHALWGEPEILVQK